MTRRLIGLDVLRLVAVVLVLGRHMPALTEGVAGGWEWLLVPWKRGGWVGVDLFFVLSGFLVSGLLFQEYKLRGSFSILHFYARRGWKIYPPFLVLIAATVIARVFVGRTHYVPPYELAVELLFLQSYLPGLWTHTWSLAVEEHFYLLLPLALSSIVALSKNRREPLKPVLLLCGVTALAALVFRLATSWQVPDYSHLTHLFPSHLRLDSLAAGVAISYAYHFNDRRIVALVAPWRFVFIAGGAALLAPAFLFDLETTPFLYTWGLSVFYIGSSMLLLGFLASDLSHSRIAARLAALGSDSYSIYLWHMPVLAWFLPLTDRIWGTPLGFGARFVVYLLGSLILGVAMARVIERPSLRLRDLWLPRRATTLDSVSTGADKA